MCVCRSEVKVKGQPWVPQSQVPSNSLFSEIDYLSAWNLPSTLVWLASSGISVSTCSALGTNIHNGFVRTCDFGRSHCYLYFHSEAIIYSWSKWLGVIKRNFSGSLNWDKLNLAPLLSSETRSNLKQRSEIVDRGGEKDEGDLVFSSIAQCRDCLFSAILIQPCSLSIATILNWLFPLGIYRILNKSGGGGLKKRENY